jgi:hypothetical protein
MANANELLAQIEARRLWAYFHKEWIAEIRRLVRPQVPANYSVFVESETILLSPEGPDRRPVSLPDLAIARSEPATGESPVQPASSTAAVIELEEPYEIFTRYSLVIRRSPDQQLVAALEMLSPSNKGIGSRVDMEKYLRKRDSYTEAGINLFEIDALKFGERLLPDGLSKLAAFERNAWTAFHHDGKRRLRGCGWNAADPLPVVPWQIEDDLHLTVDLDATARAAMEFNPWERLASKTVETS